MTTGTPIATPRPTRDASDVVEGPIGDAHLVDPTDAEPLSADLEALPAIDDTEPPDAGDAPTRRRRSPDRARPRPACGGPYPSDVRIAFAADHAGAACKDELIARLDRAGLDHELIDLGGDGSDPTDDYPDFAQRLGAAIQAGDADRGILICGSGVGASVAANKMRGIRAAICHDTYSAHQGVEHDDMNVLTLGARVIGPEPAFECALAFIARHVQRRAPASAPAGQGPGDRIGHLTGPIPS